MYSVITPTSGQAGQKILVCHETKKLYTTERGFMHRNIHSLREHQGGVPSAVNYLCNMLFPSGSFRFYLHSVRGKLDSPGAKACFVASCSPGGRYRRAKTSRILKLETTTCKRSIRALAILCTWTGVHTSITMSPIAGTGK
jgi:hypothetical protein